MIVTAFLEPDPRAGLDDVLGAARALDGAGVHGIGLLDSADTDGTVAPSAFESTTLAARIAMETSSIGVIAANSALYGFPYHAARRLATLDHVAGGRTGWLLRTRTAPAERAAFRWQAGAGRGEELCRAAEFARIALDLWDSWEDGAQYPDQAGGDFTDDARIHPVDYRSVAFRVAGPLDTPPSPQRRPVLFAEIADAEEAHHLAGPADVAVVVAPDPDTARRTAALVSTRCATTTALLACRAGAGGGPVLLTPGEAAGLVGAGVAAGVALHLAPSDATAATGLMADLGPTPRPAGPLLAPALGLGPSFTDRGSAA